MTAPLLDALTIAHPTPVQTAYLQACLLRGEQLTRTWPGPFAEDGALLGFLRTDGRELRGHLPLLYRTLTSEGIDIPRAVEPYLRAAVLRAELRHQKFQRCCDDVLMTLNNAHVEATVVKGAALARTIYAQAFLRHCHDLDLWVSAGDAERAASVLQTRGYVLRWCARGTICLEHPDGLPVLLHAQLLPVQADTLSSDALRDRRQRLDDADSGWLTLARPDALAHVLAHAATRGRRSHANWVVDAHLLSARMTAPEWVIVADDLERAGVALSALSLLAYLIDTLSTPVPRTIIERLERAAHAANGAQLLAAIDGARFGNPGGLGAMLARAGWRSRWTVGRLLLARRIASIGRAVRRGPARLENTVRREAT